MNTLISKKEVDSQIQQALHKVVLVGDSSVGKTHILNRYVTGELPRSNHATLGIDFMIKSISLNDEMMLRINFFDTSGEEKYHAVTACHYRKAAGAIIVYDITNR